MIAPLADRTFRHLFAARVVALTGTGLTTVALALLAYDLAGGDSGLVLGTALALKMVAYVVVAPAVGGVADRLPRRSLLVTLDLVRAGFVLCLIFVDTVWQIYVLIFLMNACSAGFTPVYQATVPDVVPDEDRYTEALSLSRLAYEIERLLSPAIAALILLRVSYGTLFSLNGAAFLASALLVFSIRVPSPKPSERPAGVLLNLSYGVRSYLATPRLRGLLLLESAVAAAGAMVIVNTVVYVREGLGRGESDTAIAFAASGAGSMLAALAIPRLLRRYSLRPVMLAGGGLLVGALAFAAFQPGFVGLLVAWWILGTGWALVETPAGQLLRISCQPGDRSAFFSAQFALSHAAWLVAYPTVGWLGVTVGLGATSGLLCAAAAVAVLAAATVWPAREEAEVEHSHRDLVHEHAHVHDEHHRHEHEGPEGLEPHSHRHRHEPLRHSHPFVIDTHHSRVPPRGEDSTEEEG